MYNIKNYYVAQEVVVRPYMLQSPPGEGHSQPAGHVNDMVAGQCAICKHAHKNAAHLIRYSNAIIVMQVQS